MFVQAEVNIQLRVSVGNRYSEEASLEQVYKQAGDEAVCKVTEKILGGSIAIIGKPRVTAVISQEDKK